MSWLASVVVQLSEWLLSSLFALIAKDYKEHEKEVADEKSAKQADVVYEQKKTDAQTKQESKDAGKDLLNS